MNLIKTYLSSRMKNELLTDIMRIKDGECDCGYQFYMDQSLEIAQLFDEMKERRGPYGPKQ